MKKEIWIGKKGFRYWYYRYRDSEWYMFSIVGFALIISVALVIYWIIPELNNWFSIRDEVIATRQQIAILQQNNNFLNNLDRNMLNRQLQVATEALPAVKDFGGIINVFSNASAGSGITLNNYSFQIGDIASSSGQILYNGLSTVQIILTINGNTSQLTHFIQLLESSLPLSEVTNVNGNAGNYSLTVQFYQKPFPPANFSAENPLTPLTAHDTSLIQMLTKWQVSTTNQNAAIQESSASGLPLF